MKKTNLLVVVLIAATTGFPITRVYPAFAAMPEDTQKSTVPAPLKALGESGEHAFEKIYAHKYGKTLHDIAALHKNAARLEGELSSNELDSLYESISALEKGLSINDRHAALLASNHITAQVADASRPYHPSMPVEVVLLDYNGRELLLWAEADDLPKLKDTAKNIHVLWKTLIPDMEKRQESGVVQTFGTLVERLNHATTTHDYADVATPLLDGVDDIEKIYGE